MAKFFSIVQQPFRQSWPAPLSSEQAHMERVETTRACAMACSAACCWAVLKPAAFTGAGAGAAVSCILTATLLLFTLDAGAGAAGVAAASSILTSTLSLFAFSSVISLMAIIRYRCWSGILHLEAQASLRIALHCGPPRACACSNHQCPPARPCRLMPR